MVKPIPEGTRTVTPHLVIKGAAKAIDFYKQAFGAQEHYRMDAGGGMIGHAQLQIGDSLVYLADEWPQGAAKAPSTLKGSSVVVHLYVEDVDAAFQRALAAGAKVAQPLMDMFWGDRFGQVRDPFGHVWSMATKKEDVSPEEMARRGKEAMAAMAPPAGKAPAARKPAKKAARPSAKAKGKARRKR